MLRLHQAHRQVFIHGLFSDSSLVAFLFSVLSVALVSFKGLLQLGVIVRLLLFYSSLTLAFLLTSAAKNLNCSLTLLLITQLLPFLFLSHSLFDCALEDLLVGIVEFHDGFLFFRFFVCEVFVFLFTLLLFSVLVICHALTQLLLVVLLRHLAIEHKLLIEGVSQSDLGWQGAGSYICTVVLNETHCILAENGTWLLAHLTINLLFAAQ